MSSGYKGAKPVPVKFKAKMQTWVYKSRTETPGKSKVEVSDEGIKVESDKPIEVQVPHGTDDKKTGTDE